VSDSYQHLAFDTVSASDGAAVGDKALRWMIAAEYVSAFKTECAYSEDLLGHSPGPRAVEAVDVTREFRGLRRPQHTFTAEEAIADTAMGRINGVHIGIGRLVLTAGQNVSGLDGGVCPSCKARAASDDLDDILAEHAAAWFDRKPSDLTCDACGAPSRLEDWDFEPYWAFSEVALTFWNWPILSEHFIIELKKAIAVPRVRQIIGRL
jgi:hypothetical protein